MAFFNNMDNAELVARCSAYGEIRKVQEHPTLPGGRIVEFFDIRSAEQASRDYNGGQAKIATINEVRCTLDLYGWSLLCCTY